MENFRNQKEKSLEVATEEINALHSEHLKEGVRPIMAALIDSENLGEETKKNINEIRSLGESVDWFEDSEYFEKHRMKSPEKNTYVISDIDGKDKFSEGYAPCTGVALVGVDKKTGENISFLSHQDPEKFLLKYKGKFKLDLSESMEKMIEQCEPKTIDAVVFGGSAADPYEYIDSIKLLSAACEKELGFEPVVLTGPNDYYWKGGRTHVYLDTENRRLYIVRPAQRHDVSNEPHLFSEKYKK